MPMIRVYRDFNNPHSLINKTFLNDKTLSLKAKGLFSYIISKSTYRRFTYDELTSITKDGIKSVKSAIKELQAAKYILIS